MQVYEKDSSGRRIYPQHVKDDVITLVAAGASPSEVAAQFDISPKIIRKWRAARKSKLAADQLSSKPRKLDRAPSDSDQSAEIKKLRAEVFRLQRREAILKKALSIINPAE